ncbi:uncharacterized protein ACLA_071570 [Aspergillus clavatus NRRL 1]|uniref:Uncharacterized protein n=1 Tax=Aspergillus clavatus (strain ATCC 1007 / CBS 513.65 / DSM 816 / NCTC 3887 / NRRL 1 / QM 1276 / 107) TaxID=344612 RepID=A1C6V3_ASPCL|nr:uncharacterized protein ACLA_071570 [Aspergillus clavatus NRRL 1]EAW14124.1 hypothetical protein ACLA_071570 [Aspergillus clavatus NRRL 1]
MACPKFPNFTGLGHGQPTDTRTYWVHMDKPAQANSTPEVLHKVHAAVQRRECTVYTSWGAIPAARAAPTGNVLIGFNATNHTPGGILDAAEARVKYLIDSQYQGSPQEAGKSTVVIMP